MFFNHVLSRGEKKVTCTQLTCKPEETMHRVASILLINPYLKLLASSITLPLSCKSVS